MEKHPQDKSSTDSEKAFDQDPDRYNAGYGSFNEKDFDSKDDSHANDGTPTGLSDKANIKTGLNEDKSTVSDTSAPSGSISDKQKLPDKSEA